MRYAIVALALMAAATPALAGQTYVKGHIRKDGTYVQPHIRSSPNSTRVDNYSSSPNVNPMTGKPGKRDPWTPPPRVDMPKSPFE